MANMKLGEFLDHVLEFSLEDQVVFDNFIVVRGQGEQTSFYFSEETGTFKATKLATGRTEQATG